jgi:anti-anti-sigma factor
MATTLTLDTARRGDGQLVLVAAGEVDLSNIDTFSRALATATAEAVGDGGSLLVDISAVEYLDSSAINSLATHADQIHVIAHPLLMTILRISGLTELTTVEAASPTAGR